MYTAIFGSGLLLLLVTFPRCYFRPHFFFFFSYCASMVYGSDSPEGSRSRSPFFSVGFILTLVLDFASVVRACPFNQNQRCFFFFFFLLCWLTRRSGQTISVSQGWRRTLSRFVILLRALTANSWTPSNFRSPPPSGECGVGCETTSQAFESTNAHVQARS